MIAITFVLFIPLAAHSQDAPVDPLAAVWKDLLSSEEAKATRAALALAAKPQEAVAFLKTKLRPVKADTKTIARLVADLSNKDYQTRETAQSELQYFGKYIRNDLQTALAAAGDAETKSRITKLIDRLVQEENEAKFGEEKPAPANPNGGGGASVAIRTVNGVTTVFINGKPIDTTPKLVTKLDPLQSWVRANRAIAILEHIGTAEAKQLLEAISLGEDTAAPTVQAQDALARLKRQK